jgi:hypothetical protein
MPHVKICGWHSMNPPVETQAPETLEHAVESLRRSDRPLTGREILRSIPPPSRVDPVSLERLLAGDSRICGWPPRIRKAPARYWTRRPEETVASALMDILTGTVLTLGDLQKKMTRPLAGFSPAERRTLVESQLNALAAAGKLYLHPPPGRALPKYSARPAIAGAYVAKLRKDLDALAAKLAPAGITREQILEALGGEKQVAGDRPLEIAGRIVEFLKTKPGGMGVAQLREELGLSTAERAFFDEAVLTLYRQDRVYLDRHDWPAGLSQEARDQLVHDGSGSYFVVIGLQNADAQSVP